MQAAEPTSITILRALYLAIFTCLCLPYVDRVALKTGNLIMNERLACEHPTHSNAQKTT